MFDLNTIWLKSNYFVLTHKSDFRKWYVILLLAATVFIVVFALTNVILYLVSTPQYNRIMTSMAQNQVDYLGIRQRSTPTPLEIGATTAISSGVGRYDIVSVVNNVNANWAASSVRYTLSVDGQETEEMTATINPQSEKYLTALNVPGPVSGTVSVLLTVHEVDWVRIEDSATLAELNFSVANVDYSSFSANDLVTHQVKAEITNRTFLSFFQTRFVVLLYDGESIVAVNYAYVEPFEQGDTQPITVQWSSIGGNVTGVAVIPDINQLDKENIIQ